MTDSPGMELEVYSDVVCPWCWIGTTRLRRAIAVVDPTISIRWRAFQLDPTAPTTPRPVLDAYTAKFGSAEAARAIIDRVTEAAAADGLDMRLDRAQRANTLDAHRLIAWSQDPEPDGTDALCDALFLAYFNEGRDIAAADTLIDCVRLAGLDGDEAGDILGSDHYHRDVLDDIATAADHGISGVPATLVGSGWAIPGAQDQGTFERILRRLASA